MLKKVLIGVGVVVVLFVAVVATRPSTYHVERKAEVAAQAPPAGQLSYSPKLRLGAVSPYCPQ